MSKEEETVATTEVGNTYGGLVLVKKKKGLYLRMEGCGGDDTGPLTDDQVDAFFILFPYCNRRTVE